MTTRENVGSWFAGGGGIDGNLPYFKLRGNGIISDSLA